MEPARRRIGLLGGSFDPPHLGHLTLAQDAYEGLRLDEVWFVPTFLSPHKDRSHVPPDQRVAMVNKMLARDPRFRCCDIEVVSGKAQFSVHTVEQLQRQHPEADFYWLIGADQLGALHLWKDVERLATLCQIVVFRRPGFVQQIPEAVQHLSLQQVDMHEILISSTEIRERIASGLPVYMFLHPDVNAHMEHHELYQLGT